jgi:prophage maintenance system killer protein
VLYEDPQDFAAVAAAVVVELAQKHPYQEMNQRSGTQYVLLRTYSFSSRT